MEILELALRVVGVTAAFMLLPLIVGQTEHKVMAHMQARLGPMYAGAFHGWAQLIADGVKFVQKEDITPRSADGPVFKLAPLFAVIPYLLALVAIPLGPGDLVGQPLDIGLFYVLAIVGVGVIAVLMAAWASANKYSLLDTMPQMPSSSCPASLRCAPACRDSPHAAISLHRRSGRCRISASVRAGCRGIPVSPR